MDTIVREQRVVSQLVSGVREQLFHLIRSELGFRFRADFLPVLQPALPQEATDRQVHRMVGGNHVHTPDVDLLANQPIANTEMWSRMALDISLFVCFFTKERVFMPAGVD